MTILTVGKTLENNLIALSPSAQGRTQLDENFDEMWATLTIQGVTLEAAMQALHAMRREQERAVDQVKTRACLRLERE